MHNFDENMNSDGVIKSSKKPAPRKNKQASSTGNILSKVKKVQQRRARYANKRRLLTFKLKMADSSKMEKIAAELNQDSAAKFLQNQNSESSAESIDEYYTPMSNLIDINANSKN